MNRRRNLAVESDGEMVKLRQRICGGEYGEEIVRKKISRVQVGKDGQLKILFRD